MWFAHDHYSRCEMKIPVSCFSSLISLCSFFFSFLCHFAFPFFPIWSIRMGLSMSRSTLNFDQPCENTNDWMTVSEWVTERREREGKIEGCYDMLSSMIMLSNEPLIFAPVLGSRALLSCLLSPSSSLRSPVWYPFFMLRIARLDDSSPSPFNWLYHSAQAEWWTQCVFSTSYRLNCSLHWQMIPVISRLCTHSNL